MNFRFQIELGTRRDEMDEARFYGQQPSADVDNMVRPAPLWQRIGHCGTQRLSGMDELANSSGR